MVSQHITTHSSWLQVHTVDQTVLPPPSIALLASVCLMAAGPLLFHAKNCRLQTALCLVFGVCDWLSVLPPPTHPFRYDFLLLPWLLFWLFSQVQRFDTKVWKTKFDCPGWTENTISMICWSCVLETDFDTQTTPTAGERFVHTSEDHLAGET